jgi:hypothetical protein
MIIRLVVPLGNTNLRADIDEYLPLLTLNWCTMQLIKLGYPNGYVATNSSSPLTGKHLHRLAYIQLRKAIRTYFLHGDEPTLGICKPPKGGRAWQPTPEVAAGQTENMEILGDNEDPLEGGGESEIEDYVVDVWVTSTDVN